MTAHLYLTEKGYLNHHPDPINREAMVYYKKMPGTKKHQLEVKEWPPFNVGNVQKKHSYDVEMTYETEFGIWATTKFYGLDADELKNMLPTLEDRLAKSLVCMGANPMHYRYDGED